MTGLVLEGGAMRGMFTAGVIDVMMEHGIEFDGAIGVSAGAAFGCNYKSKQSGRVIRYNLKYCQDNRYCSLFSLITSGNLYNANFCYHKLPEDLDRFDFRTFKSNPMAFYVVATDISKEALEVAKLNNQKFDANVKFLQGDMLTPLKGKKFDIFVSNPPYIPENEDVDSLVKDNEPNLALFGGDDGMKFYRIILQGLRPLLNKKALVAFEHGYDKKEEMLALCKKYFPECKAECIKDLEGKDRMTFIYVGDFTWQEE